MVKATDTKDLLRPVKMILRTWDKQSKDTNELLQWVQDINPELHTEYYWTALDGQPESKGQ